MLPSQGDFYVLPGAGTFEWIIGINLIYISILCFGIISLYFEMPVFLSSYVKSIGKKQQIGVVPTLELSSSKHLLKLWLRGMVLGFFMCNIAFSLSGNISFVSAMAIDPSGAQAPDAALMLLILWIIAIPSTLIIVPIWFMMDVGLAAAKNVEGVDFSSVNLASSRLYKIIKGYAGIGFIYNYALLIMGWISTPSPLGPLNTIAQLLSPLAVICATFPLIILMDHQKEKFKNRLEKTMVKLNLNNELKCTVELTGR